MKTMTLSEGEELILILKKVYTPKVYGQGTLRYLDIYLVLNNPSGKFVTELVKSTLSPEAQDQERKDNLRK